MKRTTNYIHIFILRNTITTVIIESSEERISPRRIVVFLHWIICRRFKRIASAHITLWTDRHFANRHSTRARAILGSVWNILNSALAIIFQHKILTSHPTEVIKHRKLSLHFHVKSTQKITIKSTEKNTVNPRVCKFTYQLYSKSNITVNPKIKHDINNPISQKHFTVKSKKIMKIRCRTAMFSMNFTGSHPTAATSCSVAFWTHFHTSELPRNTHAWLINW